MLKRKKQKKTAKKAKAAGTQSEVTYVTQLKKKGYDIILNGKGIPDIIAHSKNGWEFFEIKPYKKRSGYSRKTGKWSRSGKSRFLNKNQIKIYSLKNDIKFCGIIKGMIHVFVIGGNTNNS